MGEKYCTAGQTTDVNVTRRMRIAFWVTKARYTHTEHAIKKVKQSRYRPGVVQRVPGS
jgi:hypothetical protein